MAVVGRRQSPVAWANQGNAQSVQNWPRASGGALRNPKYQLARISHQLKSGASTNCLHSFWRACNNRKFELGRARTCDLRVPTSDSAIATASVCCGPTELLPAQISHLLAKFSSRALTGRHFYWLASRCKPTGAADRKSPLGHRIESPTSSSKALKSKANALAAQ